MWCCEECGNTTLFVETRSAIVEVVLTKLPTGWKHLQHAKVLDIVDDITQSEVEEAKEQGWDIPIRCLKCGNNKTIAWKESDGDT